MNLEDLKKPFPSNKIKWRVGATNQDKTRGLALAYVDSRVVMERLDDICGSENWQKKYSFGNNGEIICSIGIQLEDEWVWKSGGAGQTNFEAIKGGLSDAFKRAGVCWGIGRYLYQLPQIWVDIEQKGNSYIIKDDPKLPLEFLPAEEQDKKHYVEKIRRIYQQDPGQAGETITSFLSEVGIEDADDLSNISKLEIDKIKKLATKLQQAA
ncbi:hypothetical protein JCM16358_11500 [Halanaerocella petrolearia]